ncbi:MAG TPA: PDDEXK nuclease domain-containing protein [Bacilli bacterium]|nr:PDDEXK nuclease domain-containing protein [Bacilli bacterium]
MNYYDEIKNELINNEIYKKVKDYSKNKSDLNTYYNVGKLLVEAGNKYGEQIIKNYSIQLKNDLNKNYGIRNLYNMRLFYNKMSTYPKLHTACAKLSWSHIRCLLNFEETKISYYIAIIYEHNLSVRELAKKIKNQEYERLDHVAKQKLINKEANKIEDFIKNPVLIKNNYNYSAISEKLLKQLILEDLDNFLLELGINFTYIKSEYKIKIGDRYNYIDLLLYNIDFNCYVVVELKVTELKAEYVGQVQKYMNYIDKNKKNINQDKTIGIIICKKDNKFIMKYCSDERIFAKEYNFI